MSTTAPRGAVAGTGSGITDISASVQMSLGGAVTVAAAVVGPGVGAAPALVGPSVSGYSSDEVGAGCCVWLAGAVRAAPSDFVALEHDCTMAKTSSTATPSTMARRRQ
jgi:hypothetical protein